MGYGVAPRAQVHLTTDAAAIAAATAASPQASVANAYPASPVTLFRTAPAST